VRNPESVRPWQHVLEPLCGYIILAQQLATKPQLASAYNFGPDFNEAASVRSVIEMAQAAWANEAQVQWGETTSQLYEAVILRLDTSKSQNELQVVPVWGIDQAVYRTVAWYKSQTHGANALALCVSEIKDFENKISNEIHNV
jgi:CDP-glucose 4,6-dehydratase